MLLAQQLAIIVLLLGPFSLAALKYIIRVKRFHLQILHGNMQRNFCRPLILSRIPQRLNLAIWSGFSKCKQIPQLKSGFPEFGWVHQNCMRIPLTICGFRLQLIDSARSCGFSDSKLSYKHGLWFGFSFNELLQFAQAMLRIPQVRLFLEQFWAKHCLK